MKNEKGNEKLSSVAISATATENLGRLCKRFGVNKKEFVELSIAYFSRPGRDPREGNEDAIVDRLGAIEQTLKRFQSDWHASKNSWEKNYLKPGMQADVGLFNVVDKLANSNGNAEVLAMQIILTAYLLAPTPEPKNLTDRRLRLARFHAALSKMPLSSNDAEKVKQILIDIDSVQEIL